MMCTASYVLGEMVSVAGWKNTVDIWSSQLTSKREHERSIVTQNVPWDAVVGDGKLQDVVMNSEMSHSDEQMAWKNWRIRMLDE